MSLTQRGEPKMSDPVVEFVARDGSQAIISHADRAVVDGYVSRYCADKFAQGVDAKVVISKRTIVDPTDSKSVKEEVA